MAKNSFPLVKSGGGILSKLIGGVVVVALLIVIVKDPSGVARDIRTVIDAVVTFVSHLIS